MDEYLEIKELAKQGLSKTDIARRLGHDRHTITKYLRAISCAASSFHITLKTTEHAARAKMAT